MTNRYYNGYFMPTDTMWEFIKNNTNNIFTLLLAVVTGIGSFIVGTFSRRVEYSKIQIAKEDSFRDDLLITIDRLEKNLAFKDDQIAKLHEKIEMVQQTALKLLEENAKLRIENAQLTSNVDDLRREITRLEYKLTEQRG